MSRLLKVMLLSLLASAAWAQQPGSDTPRRPPWGDGPPPWIKDGQVDEEARRAYFAKRAAERASQGGEAAPAAGARPAENAPPEERRAFWQKRVAERAASEQDRAQGGPHAHGQDAAKPSQSGAPASGGASRWSGRGDGVIWLSDAPPFKRDGKGGGRPGSGKPAGMAGMGGMGEAGHGGGKDSVPMKRVWLRAGGNPQTARPATGEESALLQTPDGKTRELKVEPHGGPYNVQFPVAEQGYYNVYLTRRALESDILNVTIAKAEVTRGGMAHGLSKEEMAKAVAPRIETGVAVEIIRERKAKEQLHTRVNYGDRLVFQVLKGGQPVQNARVTFTSGQGWSNSVQSDEDGRAEFMVIRDYYSEDWSLFDKRHRENYLVTASFNTPEAGDYQGNAYTGSRYTATLSGAYYPGMKDYESYSDGLMLGSLGLVFTGTGVWAWRRRRVKPYKEVMFDD